MRKIEGVNEYWATIFRDEDTDRPYMLDGFYPSKKAVDFAASLHEGRKFLRSVLIWSDYVLSDCWRQGSRLSL